VNKLSALPTVLIVLAMAGCVFNEGPPAASVAAVQSAEKPGAPIDYLLEAHNNYLDDALRPTGLRVPRAAECVETALVRWGPIDLAQKQ
jgi:hypothetical protein